MFRRLSTIPTSRFNLACLIVTAVILSLLVGYRLASRFNLQDFPQYYMGGLMARHGQWDAIYPRPNFDPQTAGNIGMAETSLADPAYRQMARQHDVPDYVRFIQSPTAAMLYVPLTCLPLRGAFWGWSFLQIVAVLVTACVAGWTLTQCLGRSSKWQGLLTLLLGLSPLAYWSVRIANVTTFVAAGTALGVVGLLGRRPNVGAIGLAVSVMMKYSPAILWPLTLVRRQWHLAIGVCGALIAAILLTLPFSGVAPWHVYLQSVLPGADRAFDLAAGNQSLSGSLCRWLGTPAGLEPTLWATIRGLSLMLLVGLLVLIWIRRREIRDSAPMTLAAVSSLLGWWPIASPIYWDHYYLGLMPGFGWLIWEIGQSRWRAVVGLIALLGISVPLVIVKTIPQPEPLRSAMFCSSLLFLTLAVTRLVQGHPQRPQPSSVSA